MEPKKKRVCVVGAGISGLTTCKHLIGRGFRPTVFESGHKIGGVWTATAASTKLQSAKHDYQFTDFPWTEKVTEECPHNKQVLEYVESYARTFDLLKHVRFGEKVVGIEFVGVGEEEVDAWDLWAGTGEAFGGARPGVWRVAVRREDDGALEIHTMDFVILCIGRFSGLPNVPTIPLNKGTEAFRGKVIHSMDYCNMGSSAAAQMIKGKRVVVVGFLKSAVDIAAECANLNGPKYPCTMIVRTKRWNVPALKVGFFSLKYLFIGRFAELFFHKPREGALLWLLAFLLSPLVRIISKLLEMYFKRTIPMKKYGMLPDHSFFQAISSCLFCILPANFYNMVGEGSIVLKHSKSFRFSERGVIIEGESQAVDADVVIFATGFNGYQKLRNMFVSPWFQNIMAGTVPLYRDCIHPHIPQMAIIGYSESISSIHISEMRAIWLSHFLQGTFILPSKRSMEKTILEWEKGLKKYTGNRQRGSCISILNIWNNDQLCKDIGYNSQKKKGLFAYWFLPYSPSDYAELNRL